MGTWGYAVTDARNDLPSDKASNFNQRLRETVQTYLGRQGSPLDRGLTIGDLVDAGILRVRDGFSLGLGRGGLPIAAGANVDNANAVYKPDLTPPPTPEGFAVSAAISNIFIECSPQIYTQGHGHMKTVVYGVVWNSGPLPVFADAIKITEFGGTVHAYPTNPATTWRIWIKWMTADGVLSSAPAGGTNGLAVTTGQDVSLLLAALTGGITASQLASSLSTPIGQIPSIGATANSALAQANSNLGVIGAMQAELSTLSGTADYDNMHAYAYGDIVKYSGGLYKATTSTTSNAPTNNAYWVKIGEFASLGDAVSAHALQLADHDTRIIANTGGLTALSSSHNTLNATVENPATGLGSKASIDYVDQASANAVSSSATSSKILVSSLDALAEASLRNSIFGNTSSASLTGSIALAKQEMQTLINEGTSAEASYRMLLAAKVDDNYAAVQTEALTQAGVNTGLLAQYTVKVDTNGHVSGFGLANTAPVNGAPFSEFIIRADQFAIAPVATDNTAVDGSPFFYRTVATVINGVSVPAGAYMKSAYIHDATITNAKIANLAVDDAKIGSMAVDKLTSGTLSVGQYAQSTGYVAGASGWKIHGNGTAEFQTVIVRGTVYATAGLIGGNTIDATGIQSPGYVAGSTGWRLDTSGLVKAFSYSGQRVLDLSATGSNPVLKIGSALSILADGTATFSGSGTFGGALSAATGTFAGSLTAATGTFGGALLAGTFDLSTMVGVTFNHMTPGTYYDTCPAGYTQMRVTMVGGGGGGGYGDGQGGAGHSGGGGGGGGLVNAVFTVTAGQTVTVVVGGGGGPGGAGGATYVSGFTSAGGGGAGGNGGAGAGGGGTTPGSSGVGSAWRSDSGGAGGNSGGNRGLGGGGAIVRLENESFNIYAYSSPGTLYGGGGGGGSPIQLISGKAGAAGFATIEFSNPNGVVLKTEYTSLLNALSRQGIATI